MNTKKRAKLAILMLTVIFLSGSCSVDNRIVKASAHRTLSNEEWLQMEVYFEIRDNLKTDQDRKEMDSIVSLIKKWL